MEIRIRDTGEKEKLVFQNGGWTIGNNHIFSEKAQNTNTSAEYQIGTISV